MSLAAAFVRTPSFKLADRLKIQQELIRDRKYTIIGRLSSVLFEGQRNLKGFSQARPRWTNPEQSKLKYWPTAESRDRMAPFSKEQLILWSSLTLDWLGLKTSPILAITHDKQNLVLPLGLTALPPIPDPRWMPKTAGEICPRIPQLLTGCPVVGDRVRDKITARDGRVYGILHPILELSVLLAGVQGGFGKITGAVDHEGSHLALMIDDSDPERMRGYFVGGSFKFGG